MNSIKEHFDQIAEQYDFVNTLTHDYSFFLSHLSSQRNRALDIGCGSGILAAELAAYYKHVVGIDIAAEMLRIARKKRQSPRIQFIEMDAQQLSFQQPFDLIVSRTTFHHLQHIPLVVEQMKQLLNKHGKIVIMDNVSEVETPSALMYRLGAIQEFIPNCNQYGFKHAVAIFKHHTSKHWLAHLASDRYLSEQAFKQIFGKLLPGCTFYKLGWAMGVVWEKTIH